MYTINTNNLTTKAKRGINKNKKEQSNNTNNIFGIQDTCESSMYKGVLNGNTMQNTPNCQLLRNGLGMNTVDGHNHNGNMKENINFYNIYNSKKQHQKCNSNN